MSRKREEKEGDGEEEGKRGNFFDQPQSIGVTRHVSPPLFPKFQ
jgi:hypothetical protein